MESVEDFADEFYRRARNGEQPKVRILPEYAEAFLGQLCRLGLSFSRSCLNEISDPQLRRVIEGLFFPTVAGALVGLAIGAAIEAVPVAKSVAVGAACGFAVGFTSLVICALQDPDSGQLLISVR